MRERDDGNAWSPAVNPEGTAACRLPWTREMRRYCGCSPRKKPGLRISRILFRRPADGQSLLFLPGHAGAEEHGRACGEEKDVEIGERLVRVKRFLGESG